MKKILYFFLLINFNDYIKCDCFEYSCEQCVTEQYGKCTRCREGFTLIDGTCPCLDSSCALCDKNSSNFQQCYQCKNGYYNFDSKCHCDLENCNVCGEYGCLKCNYGYYYNIISEKCEEINCHDNNCRLCFSQDEGTCFLCKETYSLSNGECTANTGSNDNIGDYHVIDSSFCDKECNDLGCTEEYIENGETYYKCASNNCLKCKDNILYTIDNCENSYSCNLDGCMVCRTYEKCCKCRQGYRLDNGNCLKCPKGCSKCRTNDKCDYCFSGYQLNSDMQCILSNTFDFNTNIYKSKKKDLINKYYQEIYINEELSQDIKCDQNCNKCYDNTGICKECKTNYNLVDNMCIYECSSPDCTCKTTDCEKCSNKKHNSCTKCKNGRQLIDGRCWNIVNNCQENIPECILCNGHDKCYSCSDNYNLNEGRDYCKKKINVGLIVSLSVIGFFVIIAIVIISFNYKKICPRIGDNNRNVPNNQNNNNDNNNNDNNNNNYESDRNRVLSLDRKKRFQKEFDEISNKVSTDSKSNEKCNICFKTGVHVAHFACGCAFAVCRECYVECKFRNIKCPGCRGVI